MEHSDEYDHDNRDNNENSGSEEANYVSDDSVIEDFDDTANNYSRAEASFHPQDVTVMSQDVTHAIELDPSFLPYGTNINKLLARDPVHEQIMRLVEKCATQAIIPFYAKVNFVKLAAINKAKENKIQDVEFTAMMEVVDLAQRGKERRNAENEYERTVLDCTDQVRWLQSKTNQNLKRKVAVVFKTILKSIGCEIFAAIDARTVDDLSCILVAATSDWYYRTAPDRMQDSDMTDQATITMSFATSSSLNRNIKPPKAPSAPVKRICVNIITHLSLLGGKPANSNRFYTHDRAGFDEFMDRLLKARLQSRSRYPERLGFLTDQQMKLGKWLYHIATSMETLDSERIAWRVVDESSYKTLSFGENEQIFLIHEYHQSIPARIKEKLRSMPKLWNLWNIMERPTLDGPPAPEFLPCFEDIVAVPTSLYLNDLAKALPKPYSKGFNVEQQKEKNKGRRNKKIRSRRATAAKLAAAKPTAAAEPAAFTLPLR